MNQYKSIRLFAAAALMLSLSFSSQADDSKQIPVTDDTFKCLTDMTPARGFFVANLLGSVEETLKVANSPNGGRYPPGSVVQLIPSEVMVKHQPGWNAATKDWEFFELEVSESGSRIKVRGDTQVVNRFGGNCFGCHVAARPEWDLICGKDHGCAPLPITTERILAIQKADPRCKKREPAAPVAKAAP